MISAIGVLCDGLQLQILELERPDARTAAPTSESCMHFGSVESFSVIGVKAL